MVKSNKEYVAAHRARKAALAFSSEYLDSALIATPDEFISAKEAEFCVKHNVGMVQMSQGLINGLFAHLKDYFESEDDKYSIDDLYIAWREAEKET